MKSPGSDATPGTAKQTRVRIDISTDVIHRCTHHRDRYPNTSLSDQSPYLISTFLQASGSRFNELVELLCSDEEVREVPQFKLGKGITHYFSTFADVSEESAPNATIYEQVAFGIDNDLVNMAASIDHIQMIAYSSKVHGDKAEGAAIKVALKSARGDGIFNIGVLLVFVVRSELGCCITGV